MLRDKESITHRSSHYHESIILCQTAFSFNFLMTILIIYARIKHMDSIIMSVIYILFDFRLFNFSEIYYVCYDDNNQLIILDYSW